MIREYEPVYGVASEVFKLSYDRGDVIDRELAYFYCGKFFN